MEDYPDFTQPWNHGDIIFIVEGRKLYASKAILCMWSPVMEAMFSHNFKERDATEVELPGKDYEEMNELMRVVHPPMKPVDGEYNDSFETRMVLHTVLLCMGYLPVTI